MAQPRQASDEGVPPQQDHGGFDPTTALQGLPRIAYTAAMARSEPVESEEILCSICLEEYRESDVVIVLPCMHRFHENCMASWTKTATFADIWVQTVIGAAGRK